MQRRKTGKISIFNSLDVIFDFLTSRVENSNRVSIQDRYQIESECWNRVFESNQKIDIEYLSRVRRLISKLDLMISLATKHHNTRSIASRCFVQFFEFLSDRRKLSIHTDQEYDSRSILKCFKRICEFREFLHSKSQSSFDLWVS